MISWREALAASAIVLLAAVLVVLHVVKGSPPAAVLDRNPTGAVGALVVMNRDGTIRNVFCTASVVRSPRGNLILTSAHCLGRLPVTAMAFVPGYHGGSRRDRYRLWPVTRQDLPAHWFPGGNVNLDFAFLTVRGDVQAKTGAETLGTSSPVPVSVQVIGYTLAGDPVTCTRPPAAISVAGQRQLTFACRGYDAATSGAPFLAHVNPKTGNGTVIGVIGGYQQGGTASVSYSSPFGAAVKALSHGAQHPGPAATPDQQVSALGALVIMNPKKTIWPAFCTASVVSSRAGNLILTAAHCLGRIAPGKIAFIPGYRGGTRQHPYGLWRVTGQIVPRRWFPLGDVNADFAFITVRGDVQAKTGAETLGTSAPPPASVQVIGYTESSTYPISCTRHPTTIAVFGQRQLRFPCDGYVSATSGAPFLVHVNPKTGNGTVIGVIGGYQQGGILPSVSYSSPFGTIIKTLYNTATRKG
jgi:V8-like Glu-specific endopeptidase